GRPHPAQVAQAEIADVQHPDAVAAHHQLGDEDGAEVAGPPRDQDVHATLRSASHSTSTTYCISSSVMVVKKGRVMTRRARSSVGGRGRSAKRRKYCCSWTGG